MVKKFSCVSCAIYLILLILCIRNGSILYGFYFKMDVLLNIISKSSSSEIGKENVNMKGITGWDYKPYTKLNQLEMRAKPFVCRIAPDTNEIELEWFDNGSNNIDHTLFIGKHNNPDTCRGIMLDSYTFKISDLESDCDYVLYIQRNTDGEKSSMRIVRTGFVPGTVVNYLHPDDKTYSFSGNYLCSPSLLKLSSGSLLASMDVYKGKAPQNLTLIFRSDDNGKTWRYVTDLFPCFWGKLFEHKGKVYMLATSTEYGDLLIGCSEDEGRHWTAPVRILPGSSHFGEDGPHKAPMPVIHHEGRLWTAIDYGSWSLDGHSSALLSISADSDLLEPSNWECTEFVKYDPSWEGTVKGNSMGCLEGNAVVTPNGEVVNFLRYQINNCEPNYGKALILKACTDQPEKPLRFDRVVDFNGGLSKFSIIRDEKTGFYFSIVSKTVNSQTPGQRNCLSLNISSDLYHWTTVADLLDYSHLSYEKVGFQYVDFLIDGENILYLCRTAFNGAHNFHDSNYITFHKIKNFRSFI